LCKAVAQSLRTAGSFIATARPQLDHFIWLWLLACQGGKSHQCILFFARRAFAFISHSSDTDFSVSFSPPNAETQSPGSPGVTYSGENLSGLRCAGRAPQHSCDGKKANCLTCTDWLMPLPSHADMDRSSPLRLPRDAPGQQAVKGRAPPNPKPLSPTDKRWHQPSFNPTQV